MGTEPHDPPQTVSRNHSCSRWRCGGTTTLPRARPHGPPRGTSNMQFNVLYAPPESAYTPGPCSPASPLCRRPRAPSPPAARRRRHSFPLRARRTSLLGVLHRPHPKPRYTSRLTVCPMALDDVGNGVLACCPASASSFRVCPGRGLRDRPVRGSWTTARRSRGHGRASRPE